MTKIFAALILLIAASAASPLKGARIFVVGGNTNIEIYTSIVDVCDVGPQSWSRAPALPTGRDSVGATTMGGQIYAVAGFSKCKYLPTSDVYDPVKNVWSSLADLNIGRADHGVAAMNGKIYAVGGTTGSCGAAKFLNSVEAFDPATNEWSQMADMSAMRYGVGVAVLGDYLYAVGGCDNEDAWPLRSVEKYDAKANQWLPVTPMNIAREYHSVAIVDEKLYAIGGQSSVGTHATVEVYDPKSDRWTFVANMTMERREGGAVVVDGLIYVVGGWNRVAPLDSVDVYDPATDRWTLLPARMPTARYLAGVTSLQS